MHSSQHQCCSGCTPVVGSTVLVEPITLTETWWWVWDMGIATEVNRHRNLSSCAQAEQAVELWIQMSAGTLIIGHAVIVMVDVKDWYQGSVQD